jgi:hypothetical protein
LVWRIKVGVRHKNDLEYQNSFESGCIFQIFDNKSAIFRNQDEYSQNQYQNNFDAFAVLDVKSGAFHCIDFSYKTF